MAEEDGLKHDDIIACRLGMSQSMAETEYHPNHKEGHRANSIELTQAVS